MNHQSKDMLKIAYNSLEEKKAENIKVIDITKISTVADYFIIASAFNSNQIKALMENIEESLGKSGYLLKQIEGRDSGSWILLDYRDIIVHIFSREGRLFYDLERIWRDGREINIGDLK